MASTHEYIDFGLNEVQELFDTTIIPATIIEVHSDTNTADIHTDETKHYGRVNDVPIFYHCENRETVEEGHTAFEADAEVDVICIAARGSSLTPQMKIVGFSDGSLRPCIKVPGAAIIRFKDWAFIWDFETNDFYVSEDDTVTGFETFGALKALADSEVILEQQFISPCFYFYPWYREFGNTIVSSEANCCYSEDEDEWYGCSEAIRGPDDTTSGFLNTGFDVILNPNFFTEDNRLLRLDIRSTYYSHTKESQYSAMCYSYPGNYYDDSWEEIYQIETPLSTTEPIGNLAATTTYSMNNGKCLCTYNDIIQRDIWFTFSEDFRFYTSYNDNYFDDRTSGREYNPGSVMSNDGDLFINVFFVFGNILVDGHYEWTSSGYTSRYTYVNDSKTNRESPIVVANYGSVLEGQDPVNKSRSAGLESAVAALIEYAHVQSGTPDNEVLDTFFTGNWPPADTGEFMDDFSINLYRKETAA